MKPLQVAIRITQEPGAPPVQAQIATMPGSKSGVGRRLDAAQRAVERDVMKNGLAKSGRML